MFLRCLEHERIMFGMFSTYFEHRNNRRSHPLAIFVDLQQQYVKSGFFDSQKFLDFGRVSGPSPKKVNPRPLRGRKKFSKLPTPIM